MFLKTIVGQASVMTIFVTEVWYKNVVIILSQIMPETSPLIVFRMLSYLDHLFSLLIIQGKITGLTYNNNNINNNKGLLTDLQ